MNSFVTRTLIAAALVAAGSAATAAADPNDKIILGASFAAGAGVYTEAINPLGNSVTFTSAPRKFALKTQNGYTGVGVSGGRTKDEIDIGEFVTGTFDKPVSLTSFSVNMLFDGPEYGDWNETAQVTAFLSGGGSLVGTLRASGTSEATWLVGGLPAAGSLTSPLAGASATLGGGGAWEVFNPFGSASITGLQFTALTSTFCSSRSCNNQSDYTLHSIAVTAPVPEPETYALMLGGLLAVAYVARRRKSS